MNERVRSIGLYRSVPMCCTTCSVLQIQAVYCLSGYGSETATQLFCLKLATYAKYCISNIWTVFFNMKYPPLLRNSMSKLPKTRQDDSKKLSRNFSAWNEKPHNRNW